MKQAVLAVFLVLIATGANAHSGVEPADTDFKTDICAECNMAVTSKSYAAQIVTYDKPLFFDDIGCLVQYQRKGKIAADQIKASFVRSALGDGWLGVDHAVWVLTKDVRTPMGYGLHAFPNQAAAEAFAKTKKNAKLLYWDDVPAAVPEAMGMM